MLVRLSKRENVDDMTLKSCREYVGGFSKSKKGEDVWHTTGTSAHDCNVGSKLAKIPGSTCFKCYALKGHYAMFPSVRKSQDKKLASLTKPLWSAVMTRLIKHYSPKLFRWHDSGDLQSIGHLVRIVEIAQALPDTRFWLPTREVELVREYLAVFGPFPDNIAVRISAFFINTDAPINGLDLPTSTVHSKGSIYPRAKGQIECKAYLHDNQCKQCTACFDSRVTNVSYREH